MNNNTVFESVVFAGGGSRCFWQLGFWNTVAPALNINPSVVSSVSAGAAFACFSLAADAEDILSYFKKATGINKKNIYLSNLFSRKPMFPHYKMYRDAILYGLNDDVMKKLKNGPEIRILVSRPPFWMGARLAAFISVVTYSIEKHVFYPLHPVFSSKIGFKGEVIPVSECPTREDLADLILASSCAPPLLPVMQLGKKVALDGGVIDNVPVMLLDDCSGKKLVMLTRRYKDKVIPKGGDVVYVQPSEEIRITKWEYTDPEGLQYVYDLGRRDGEKFAKDLLHGPIG